MNCNCGHLAPPHLHDKDSSVSLHNRIEHDPAKACAAFTYPGHEACANGTGIGKFKKSYACPENTFHSEPDAESFDVSLQEGIATLQGGSDIPQASDSISHKRCQE